MRRGERIRLAMGAGILGLASSLGSAEARSPDATARDLDPAFAIVAQAVADGRVPGAIALVARHGRIVRQEAFGWSDVENRRRMRPDTICWLASITKPVTVAAAMKLVEAGRLGLEDLIERDLPEFAAQPGPEDRHYPVTVRQLMCHASGIPASVPTRPRDFFSPAWLERELAEVVAPIAGLRLEFVPGSRVLYSNAAPYVLARIIERRAGRPYAEFVREKILEPLGMRETFFALPRAVAERVAVVYRRSGEKEDTFFRFDPDWSMRMTMPDGGLFAPAGDVAKLVQAFLDNDGAVLGKPTVEAMLSRQMPGWGLGWALDDDGSFHHTGSAGTLAWGDPRSGVVGVLFFQIQDQRTVQALRDQFRAAVRGAFPSS